MKEEANAAALRFDGWTRSREQITERFERVMRLKEEASGKGVKEMREYVEAMLGLEVYSHKLYECAHAEPHGEEDHHEHAA